MTLQDLGWSAHYQSQLDIDEVGTTTPARINGVHRTQIAGLTTGGPVDLTLDPGMSTAEIAVVGPETITIDEPQSAATTGVTMAVYSP